MRSNKKYTNQTISKRVDHEAGRHRPPRASSEPVVCEVCGNVYSDRRWAKPDASRQSPKHPHIRPPKSVICPACQAERDGIAGGYVHLEGEFLKTHHQEIERLLNNEAARAAEDNPLARIMKMETDKK